MKDIDATSYSYPYGGAYHSSINNVFLVHILHICIHWTTYKCTYCLFGFIWCITLCNTLLMNMKNLWNVNEGQMKRWKNKINLLDVWHDYRQSFYKSVSHTNHNLTHNCWWTKTMKEKRHSRKMISTLSFTWIITTKEQWKQSESKELRIKLEIVIILDSSQKYQAFIFHNLIIINNS